MLSIAPAVIFRPTATATRPFFLTFTRRLLWLCCLCFGTLSSAAIAAGTAPSPVDAFLAQPADTGSITPEQAKTTIAQAESYVAASPERRPEIEAYLIPFRRAVAASAQPAPAPTPSPSPSPKPYLLIKTLAGSVEAVRAQSATLTGGILNATLRDGSPAAWQKDLYLGYLPWYTDQELDSPSNVAPADLNALAASYDAKAAAYPAARSLLSREAAKLRGANNKLKDRADRAARRAQDLQAKRTGLFAQPYDPKTPYTREALAKLLLDAEALRRSDASPDQQSKIDEQTRPYRQHFENLLADKQYVNGTWQSSQKVDDAQQQLDFEKSLDATIDARAVPDASLERVLGVPILAGVVVTVLGLCCLVGKRSAAVRLCGLAFLAGPLTAAVYVSNQARNTAALLASNESADASRLIQCLYSASQQSGEVSPEKYETRLTEADLNAFLTSHFHFTDQGGQPSPLDARRTRWLVRMQPGAAILLELVQWAGGTYPVQYDLGLDAMGSLRCRAVKIGAFAAPAPLRNLLWKSLLGQLGKLSQANALLAIYPERTFAPGVIRLAVTRDLPSEIPGHSGAGEEQQAPAPVVSATPEVSVTRAAEPPVAD